MSEPLPPTISEDHESTSFAAGSPVRTLATPEGALELMENKAGCGRSSSVSFASYDPSSRSWRTSQHSLFGGLTEFSETWPRAGMTRSGNAFQLRPLVRHISETGCGLLPTPCREDSQQRGAHRGVADTLTSRLRMLPTPNKWDGKRGGGIHRNPQGPRRGRAESGVGNQVWNAECSGLERPRLRWTTPDAIEWSAAPRLCGRNDGVPDVVDRLAALGNAVVPQVAEWIGRRIIEAEARR